MKNIITNKIFVAILFGFTFVLSFSCGEKVTEEVMPKEIVPKEEPDYTSEYAYNLNVIYFVSKDRVANSTYEERISEIMITAQAFFNKWMKHWGYGDITFGLLKDNAKRRIKIHTIKGTQNSSFYSNDVNIKSEIDQYFAQNPRAKTSDHFLVISAVNEMLGQGENLVNSVPFHASGRYGYALDYPGMSEDKLGLGSAESDRATVYIGGLLHEMGHAINLPHNGPNNSKRNSPEFGMTLMGSGNYSYGKNPTYISHFDAATLANCQLFFKETKISFYGAVTSAITEMKATYEGSDIVVSGKFTSSVPVKNVSFYNKRETDPFGYAAITWTVEPGNDNSFAVSMPIAEFIEKGNLNYELDLFFHHDNGTLTSKPYGFKFINDIPQIQFGNQNYLDRTGWIVTSASVPQSGYAVTNVLDGNINSYWHTSWSDTSVGHPHFVSVKTGTSPVNARGFALLPRPESGTAGKIKNFTIEISDDGNAWTQVYVGSMTALNGYQYFDLDETKTFNYFKITSLSDHQNERFASLAEINLYQ